MPAPYATTRTGSAQWLMQRVSAALLVFFAFLHFGIQHFTSDAVSTGLTVAARANNPWWQAFYIVFVVLALYHGVNGVIGIIRDYNPKPILRLVAEWTLWTLAVVFGALGVKNFVNPRPLGEVKALYAQNGFPFGDSAGNPPVPGGAKTYDFRTELRELRKLVYYLEHHTAGGAAVDLGVVLGHGGDRDKAVATHERVSEAGVAFDAWCLTQIVQPAPRPEQRDRAMMFSGTREFAIWAANVRRTNADLRQRMMRDGVLKVDPRQREADLLTEERLKQVPAYSATELY